MLRVLLPQGPSRFWSVHTHSAYSAQDALPSVADLVALAERYGYPALGLTDHGNMAGSVELYKECTKRGIKPFPGTELYLVESLAKYRADYADKTVKAQRYHLGMVATNLRGYENLVALNTLAHSQHFHKPTLQLSDLAAFYQDGRTAGLAVLTGCYFGMVVQRLVTQGKAAAKQLVATLDSWFPGSTYVEIQNHHIDHGDGWNDDLVADALVGIADELGLPVVITQDSHYLYPHDKEAHDALKRLVSFGPDPDDAVFPGDGFHLATDSWIEAHHSGRRLDRGLDGLQALAKSGELRIPVLDTYRYNVPLVLPEPDAVLRERCERALGELSIHKFARYRRRLEEELEVVRDSRMAGYLLLVAEVCDYMRDHRMFFQTRGSAGGSLLCWLLGITQHDPLKWNLMFERFLSKDRTKPPDIDLDIAHDQREDLIAWLSTRFSVHQIGTWMQMSLTGDEESSKGSLLVKYYSKSRKVGGATRWAEVPEADRAVLKMISGHGPYAGCGTNAAGMVLTSTRRDFDALVPLMHVTDPKAPQKRRLITQYELGAVENLGLVKLDVLGVKTLSVLRRSTEMLGKTDLDWIPLDDKRTFALIRSGNTDGIFQLEGLASRRGVRQLRPSKIQDVIAAMALFRPATMASGATESFIRRKHGEEKVAPRHQIIDQATKTTYGVLLYQEQVIEVLRRLGMGADDLTSFLKAVKASNANIGNAAQVISSLMSQITDLCDVVGMNSADKDWLAEALAAYSGYGFNSAHATVYGITAYKCAYLALHHPLEFHTALLSVAAGDPDKEPGYLRATRARGLVVAKPCVNVSGITYTLDRKHQKIRKGLQSIKGIGKVAAEELVRHQPYTTIQDLCERVDHRKVTGTKGYLQMGVIEGGNLAILHEAGALNGLL